MDIWHSNYSKLSEYQKKDYYDNKKKTFFFNIYDIMEDKYRELIKNLGIKNEYI